MILAIYIVVSLLAILAIVARYETLLTREAIRGIAFPTGTDEAMAEFVYRRSRHARQRNRSKNGGMVGATWIRTRHRAYKGGYRANLHRAKIAI